MQPSLGITHYTTMVHDLEDSAAEARERSRSKAEGLGKLKRRDEVENPLRASLYPMLSDKVHFLLRVFIEQLRLQPSVSAPSH